MKALALAGLVLVVTGCGGEGGASPGGSGGAMGVTGGSSSGGNATGGTGGTGGTPGSGGTGAKARGAVSMHIIETPGCSLMEQYQDFPIVPGGRPVTATGVVKMVEHESTDNGQPVRVACSIRGDTAPYQFLAVFTIGQGNERRHIDLGARFSVGMPGVESLVLNVSALPEQYGGVLPELCTYTATELDKANGRVKGSFVCENLEGFDSKEKCRAGESYFAFENCSN